ncbi:uncharacterized protein LOC129311657 isoform X2 [Prosopis cineraria]|uniref:uncharacterized protein LOC129311657 isoform X2 n=1 Tax=Prosopis cineraria TaxID=364024 RepID=UPI00241017D7|nr:uncharacterized protein LOC129311657 isoform X2 [Prosopis cineraria]
MWSRERRSVETQIAKKGTSNWGGQECSQGWSEVFERARQWYFKAQEDCRTYSEAASHVADQASEASEKSFVLALSFFNLPGIQALFLPPPVLHQRVEERV